MAGCDYYSSILPKVDVLNDGKSSNNYSINVTILLTSEDWIITSSSLTLIILWLRGSGLSCWQGHCCLYIHTCHHNKTDRTQWQDRTGLNLSVLDMSHLDSYKQAPCGAGSHVWSPAASSSHSLTDLTGLWFNRKRLKYSSVFQEFIWCSCIKYAQTGMLL